MDYLGPQCRRERTFAISELAGLYGPRRTVSEVLHRLRCMRGTSPSCPAGAAGDTSLQANTMTATNPQEAAAAIASVTRSARGEVLLIWVST